MSAAVGLLVMVGVLVWPESFVTRRLSILPRMSMSASLPLPARATLRKASWARMPPWHSGHRAGAISSPELLALLEAIAPALETGMAPAAALLIAADCRCDPGRPDQLDALVRAMASSAADGRKLGPLWREASEAADSAELLVLAQAWSLTEDMGAPLAQAVRTTAELLEARIAHERRLTAAIAGAKATVNVLTVLPIGGPLLALGLCLALIGRWWVGRMVRAVARGPVFA